MTLLAPVFLLGLAALALPLWLHRREAPETERIPFSSTLLLEPSQQPVQVRKRLRYWWLLALRIALLALLALAFSQPLLENEAVPAAEAAKLQLIVIDRSASMGYEQRFQDAIAQARNLIRDAPAGARLGLFAAAENLEQLTDFSLDRSEPLAVLARLQPGAGRADLGAMMDRVAQRLETQTTGTASAVVHVISDFQRSGLPERFSALVSRPDKPPGLTLRLHPVARSEAANWSVSSVRREGSDLLATVAGYSTAETERTLQLRINSLPSGQITSVIPAGGQQTYRFEGVSFTGGENRAEFRLAPADGLVADDVRYAVFDNSPPRPALVVRTSENSRAATYIGTALASGPRGYDVEIVPAAGFDQRQLERFAWLAIDDLTALDDALADRLRDWLNTGGRIFAALGPPGFTGGAAPVTGHAIRDMTMTELEAGAVGLDHPINEVIQGWAKVLISHAYRITPAAGDRTVAALGEDLPLLIEHEAGRGRALILASALDNRSNDLPVRRLFVGLLTELARYLDDDERMGAERVAGDQLLLAQGSAGAGQVTGPDGRALLSLGETQRSPTVPLAQTGFYEVQSVKGTKSIAVNVDPKESLLQPMETEALTRWERAYERSGRDGASTPTPAVTTDNGFPLWPALLILSVVVVLAESIVANRQLEALP